MSWDTVRTLLLHELRMLIRDRRTVILSIALPVIVMPAMILGMRLVQERREKKLEATVFQYAIGGSASREVRAILQRARGSQALGGREGDEFLRSFRFEEVTVHDPIASLKSRRIHLYLEALGPSEADALAAREQKPGEGSSGDESRVRSGGTRRSPLAEASRLPGVPLIRIHYQGDRDDSSAGRNLIRDLLLRQRRESREELLKLRGLRIDPEQVLKREDVNLASAAQVTGFFIGKILTALLLMLMLTGGSVAAMDIVAGEKERGSLETLLTTAVRRAEIVAAKQLAIVLVALVITFIQVGNLLLYLTFRVLELPESFVIETSPVTILVVLVLFMPVAGLVGAILLTISAYARSYKEAQLYFFPVYLISIVPALAAFLPGVALRSAIVLVPLANVSVAVREAMVGKYDWPMLIVTLVVMSASAGGLVHFSAAMLSKERLITASEADASDLAGGPALFGKHVLRWYAVMGAVLFTVAASFPQMQSLRRQVLFNVVVLFAGVPLLMIWKYRLSFRDALALRPVRLVAWPAVLLAIPSGHLLGIAVFRLASFVLPVPERFVEEFSRRIAPAGMTTWQLLFFIAVLPGICEEIGFRGTLLYGLRNRFRPWLLALVVGLIFGLFHVDIFRIAPAAFIGVILTAMALLTGSIFPCMVYHAGNNAIALWAGKNNFPLASLEGWIYLAAAVIFGLCMYILYRARTPYPGLLT